MIDDLVLVGSRTTAERKAKGKGLTLWDSSKPEWQLIDLLTMTNPSWITAGKGGTYYVLHGDRGEVSTVQISADRKILHRQTIDCLGLNPVHAAVTDDARLIVANYATGTIAAFNIGPKGGLHFDGSVINLGNLYSKQFSSAEIKQSHPHQILILPGKNRILVPDKGLDALFVIDISDHGLQLNDIVRTAPGSGPRHATTNPLDPNTVYVVGELDSTLMHFHVDPAGKFGLRGIYSTLPAARHNEETSAAGIVATSSKVFVSNRGHDSIANFNLDGMGNPQWCSLVDAGGACPRFIGLRGESLIVAHENGDSIAAIGLDTPSGLFFPQIVARTGSPVSVLAVSSITSADSQKI